MDALITLLPAIGCVGGMAVVMLVMAPRMRTKHERPFLDAPPDEMAELQREVERLRTELRRREQGTIAAEQSGA